MADIKVTQVSNYGSGSNEMTFEAKNVEYVDAELIKALFKKNTVKTVDDEGETVKKALFDVPSADLEVKHDVVAIYDNAGIPSIMHRFRKISNKELFGGSDRTNAAFIIGGEEYDEIFISVFENCEINGKPYSLPMQKPWTNITNDEAAKACFSKGDGWHLLTRTEWGMLANFSKRNGTLPHGNTNYGKYHADEKETGELAGHYGMTKTGSGPATWTHDHTPEGVHDLCGNIWEMVRGFRVKNGVLQAAKDNDAALDIDFGEDSQNWHDVIDEKTGNPIKASVGDEEIRLSGCEDHEEGYSGDEWGNVILDFESEKMKELAMYAGEEKTYLYIDSTEGEYLPICGGHWSSTSYAGVFCVDLSDPRSYAVSSLGFRSAYFRKRKTEN